MAGRSQVQVSGPLGEFAGGFLAELARLGYRPRSSEAQLYLMRHLSWWLGARRPWTSEPHARNGRTPSRCR